MVLDLQLIILKRKKWKKWPGASSTITLLFNLSKFCWIILVEIAVVYYGSSTLGPRMVLKNGLANTGPAFLWVLPFRPNNSNTTSTPTGLTFFIN